MKRREFLKSAAVAAVASTVPYGQAAEGIPRRPLGSTGESVSCIGLGGHHIGRKQVSEQEGIRIVRTALDNGINFLDNCWDYNDGVSEQRMGMALKQGYRQKAFLMTKLDGRTASSAQQQLEDSLRRLQTDHIDLVQIHEVIRMNDPERVFASGGTIETLVKAKQAGKLRYIGFTGHKSPEIHLHMIETAARQGFHFDTVQMPLNVMDAHFDSFEKKVIPAAQKQGIAILGMKPMGDSIILNSNVVTAPECLQYALSLPVSVVITGCESMPILEQALGAARGFHQPSAAQIAALLARTAQVAQAGKFELYKTSTHFDGTTHSPQWLG
jgi:uncharacterized protein